MRTTKKTKEQFIDEARKKHNDKYDYSKVEYINNTTKVCIICHKHGEFWQTPKQHLRGQGCPKCGLKTISEKLKGCRNSKGYKRIKYNNEKYISKLKEKYGGKYDYSKVEYKGMDTKITLICPIHGEFVKKADHLLYRNTGCKACKQKEKTELLSLGKEKFIEKANNVFHGLYDYSNVEYVNNSTKVEIQCKKHGRFLCTPQNHLRGRGCPICKSESYVYESRLHNFLKTIFNEDEIICQYTAEWLSNHKSLDFFIPKYNIGVEHQGSQHYYITRYDGDNEERLKRRINNDKDKYNECISNGINILYFTYELNTKPKNCFHELIFNEDELKKKIGDIINEKDNRY